VPFLHSIRTKEKTRMYQRVWKRMMDIVLSFVGILVLLLPMLIVAVLIKLDSPGPALFCQKRVGMHKKHFMIIKFRSMPVEVPRDVPTDEFHAEALLSKFQKILRASSLDELPQLFCIFIGTMSIIGPRPALWNQYNLVQERDKYGANDVKPGLTGWAQINGRDELCDAEKAKYDGAYAQVLTKGGFAAFMMDLRCFFKTITKVLQRDGVVEGGVGAAQNQKESETTNG